MTTLLTLGSRYIRLLGLSYENTTTGLTVRNLSVHSCQARSPRSRCWGLVFSKSSLLGLQKASLLFLHIVFYVPFCVLIPFCYEDTSQIGAGHTLAATF